MSRLKGWPLRYSCLAARGHLDFRCRHRKFRQQAAPFRNRCALDLTRNRAPICSPESVHVSAAVDVEGRASDIRRLTRDQE